MGAIISTKDDTRTPLTNLRVTDSPVVLAVDDMAANLTKIANMLPEDYEVSMAKSGAEALEVLSHTFVDLALLDIEMPVMSGVELFEKMQANPDYASIPVVFVTSEKTSTIVQKAISMGAKGYIVKPFDDNTLLSRINHALSSSKENQAVLFLKRKIKVVLECCMKKNVEGAEKTVDEIPKNVFNKVVYLTLTRVIFALHNHDFKQALETAQTLAKDLGVT